VRQFLDRSRGVRVDHVVEHITARRAAPHEAKLLGISRSAPVLVLYVTAGDATGASVVALDLAMPGDLHELEDAYSAS
jgi:GntR family transcriptional regulator